MLTLDEVIKAVEIHTNPEAGRCITDCPYHGECVHDEEMKDALHYLKVFRDAKNDYLDDLMMKTAGLQSAIDQHMTAIKELDRVKRMYKRELKAANEIRSKNKE